MKKNYVTMMRELREDHDLRQKEVAAYLKIDQRVYSRYETGRNALPIEKAILLCELSGAGYGEKEEVGGGRGSHSVPSAHIVR